MLKTSISTAIFTALAATTLGFASAASAASIVVNGSLAQRTTNFNPNSIPAALINIPKFDANLGALTSVGLKLTGKVSGTARAESLDASPANINLALQASISVLDPNSNILATAIPIFSQTFNATAHDGNIDFAGTSGITISGNNTDVVTTSYSSVGTISQFIGTGNISLGVTGVGNSNGTGAGNLITQFSTLGGADLEVTYNYTANGQAVPEPSGLLSLGLLGGLGMFAKKNQKQENFDS